MQPFPKYDQLRDLIQLAKAEDLAGDDVTSRGLPQCSRSRSTTNSAT